MPTELGPTGKLIWDAFTAEQLGAPHQALVRELARTADSLDRIAGLVSGRQDSWAELVFDDMGSIQLSIDRLADEQRKTQAIYKQLYAELRSAGIHTAASLPVIEDEEQEDMLTKRRKEKEERERQLG